MLVSLAFTSAVSLAQAEQGIDPAVSNDEGAAAEAYSSSGVAQSTLKLADSDEFEGGLNSAIEYPRQRFREEASIEGASIARSACPQATTPRRKARTVVL